MQRLEIERLQNYWILENQEKQRVPYEVTRNQNESTKSYVSYTNSSTRWVIFPNTTLRILGQSDMIILITNRISINKKINSYPDDIIKWL